MDTKYQTQESQQIHEEIEQLLSAVEQQEVMKWMHEAGLDVHPSTEPLNSEAEGESTPSKSREDVVRDDPKQPVIQAFVQTWRRILDKVFAISNSHFAIKPDPYSQPKSATTTIPISPPTWRAEPVIPDPFAPAQPIIPDIISFEKELLEGYPIFKEVVSLADEVLTSPTHAIESEKEAERLAALAHIVECSACQNRLKELRAIVAMLLLSVTQVTSSASLKERTHTAIEQERKAAFPETYTLVVQLNGKVQELIEVAADSSESEVIELVRNNPKIVSLIADATVRKVVYVPERVINFVVDTKGNSATIRPPMQEQATTTPVVPPPIRLHQQLEAAGAYELLGLRHRVVLQTYLTTEATMKDLKQVARLGSHSGVRDLIHRSMETVFPHLPEKVKQEYGTPDGAIRVKSGRHTKESLRRMHEGWDRLRESNNGEIEFSDTHRTHLSNAARRRQQRARPLKSATNSFPEQPTIDAPSGQ